MSRASDAAYADDLDGLWKIHRSGVLPLKYSGFVGHITMRMGKGSTAKIIVSSVLLLVSAGCAMLREDASSRTVHHRFAQPPQAAGACFARNAERRSSALVAEVSPPDAYGRVEVVVNVKNGVEYARLDLRPAGARSEGTIALNVISGRGTEELVSFLVEGC